jgi:creatinine amidohydrolase
MSPTPRWEECRFPELSGIDPREQVIAILPLGAVEAHGPHLPVGTDVWIAEAMAREGARLLAERGFRVFVLPAIAYAPAPFAEGFPGTLSIRPATLVELVVDLAAGLALRGVATLALASAHFDPAQVGALRAVVGRIRDAGRPRVVFPDLTRRALAERLSEEFRSGACHAGRFESSILLAERPELVDEPMRRSLREVPLSLVDAIREGRSTFEAAGLVDAYCGDPAAASAEEGRALVALLGTLLAEAVASG